MGPETNNCLDGNNSYSKYISASLFFERQIELELEIKRKQTPIRVPSRVL